MGLLTTSENFTEINMALDRCCELAHKLQVPNKQMALITDARFTANGYAVLIEDDALETFTSARKTFPPVTHERRAVSSTQFKTSIYEKAFLTLYFAFRELGHIIWVHPNR